MATDLNQKSSRDWGVIQKKDKSGRLGWYARITRVDGDGKKRQFLSKAENKTHARRLRDELDSKYRERGEKGISGDRMLFRNLADLYKTKKLHAASYHGENENSRKVGGFKSIKPVEHYLAVLRSHFGSYLLRNISHSDIEEFKLKRLKTVSRRGERSVADVNRTLALLRTMIRFAVQNGWLVHSPFDQGTPLISIADEIKRERTLSFEEESRFLQVCTEPRLVTYRRNGKDITSAIKGGRELLRSLVIIAVDTGMRKGELLKLKWRDLNLSSELISVHVSNSKTARRREIGMTRRVAQEFLRLWESSTKNRNLLVFGIGDIKNSFTSACRDANIQNFRFHDLRHTAITRMVNAGLPPIEIMKISGHTQWTTFSRYVNPTTNTIRQIASRLTDYVDNGHVPLINGLPN